MRPPRLPLNGGQAARLTFLVMLSAALATSVALVGAAAPIPSTVDLASSSPNFAVIGVEPDDGFGREFATGDFNGDGVDDLLLGVPRGDGPDNSRLDAGEAYVLFGSAALSGVRDLSAQPPDLTIYGTDGGDNLGSSLAAVDSNGDGIDDIVVGSPNADGPSDERADAGEVYVIFGSPSLTGSIDVALNEQDLTILGADPGDFAGRALDGGDMSGDGVADLIVGAPAADGSANSKTDSGEVYIVYGGAGLSGIRDMSAGQQDVTVLGIDYFDGLGSELATGDVNGDGRTDLLLAADDAAGPGNSRILAGEAHLLIGAPPLPDTIDLSATPPDLTVYGRKSGDNFGSRLAVGSVNGDAFADIIIAAQAADGPGDTRVNSGEAYVIFGSAALGGAVDTAGGEQDVTVYAAEAVDEMSDVEVDDVNGDGRQDILLGSDDADGPDGRVDGGKVYVIFGSPSLSSTFDLGLDEQDVTVIAADVQDDLGQVASGDLNGDGGSDLIVGASGADGDQNSRPDAGELYVLFGEAPPSARQTEKTETGTTTPAPDGGSDGGSGSGSETDSRNGGSGTASSDGGNGTAVSDASGEGAGGPAALSQSEASGAPGSGVGALATNGAYSVAAWAWALVGSGAAGLLVSAALLTARVARARRRTGGGR